MIHDVINFMFDVERNELFENVIQLEFIETNSLFRKRTLIFKDFFHQIKISVVN